MLHLPVELRDEAFPAQVFSGPSPGPVFDLGTKSRGMEQPRDFNGVFLIRDPATTGLENFVCTGSGNHGTKIMMRVEALSLSR